MLPRHVLALVSILPVLALAACGESREAGTGTTGTTGTTATEPPVTTGPAVATVKVSETEYKLDPSDPKVAKSGVVAFEATNDGKIDHALEIHWPEGEVETEPFPPGESRTIKIELEPGRYEWYCPVGDHKDRGMKGEITVAGGGAGGGPSTETTEDEDPPGGGGY
jgi:uncharacterized cupredoxin-like copper-binding protein